MNALIMMGQIIIALLGIGLFILASCVAEGADVKWAWGVRAKARRAFRAARDRRIADLMGLGMDERAAEIRVASEMAKEAADALKQDGE